MAVRMRFGRWGWLSMIVVLNLFLVPPLRRVLQQFKNPTSRGTALHWANLWYSEDMVRNGAALRPNFAGNVAFDSDVSASPFHRILAYARAWIYILLAHLGFLYLPELTFPRIRDFDVVTPRDHVSQFCRSLLDYQWVHPAFGLAWFPMNRGSTLDIQGFIAFCGDEFEKLSAEERALLEPFRSVGRIPQSVYLPDEPNVSAECEQARRSPPLPHDAEKLSKEEIVAMVRTSMNTSAWGLYLKDAPQSVIGYFTELDLRKPPVIAATWSEIGEAIRRGELARFDGGALFPNLVNISHLQLAAQEGEAADTIPILTDVFSPTSLRRWSEQVQSLIQRDYKSELSMMDLNMWLQDDGADVVDPAIRSKVMKRARATKKEQADTGYVNIRRLPALYSKLPDVGKEIGLDADILRAQGFLWMGALRGGFHYDEEANIYIQLAGWSDVWIVPQNFTKFYNGGRRRGSNPPSRFAADFEIVAKQVPHFVFRLGPGDGVTFPGYTFHIFTSQSAERIALNFFFIPKWRCMEYHPADWYSQEANRPYGPERLAMRQLWARSFARLWDERKRGLVYMATKNEYI